MDKTSLEQLEELLGIEPDIRYKELLALFKEISGAHEIILNAQKEMAIPKLFIKEEK